MLLEAQDRSRWNRELIDEGLRLVQSALASGTIGSYGIQAAISAVHAEAKTAEETDWPQIVALYDLLLQAQPSPVIELNRAVAVAMVQGPEAGLTLIEQLFRRGQLSDYHLAYSAQAELLRRSGQFVPALEAFERALTLAKQEPERRLLAERIAALQPYCG